MKTSVIISVVIMSLTACVHQKSISPNFAGSWQLKNVFLSDAFDQPCMGNQPNTALILNLTHKSDNKYDISGKSAVNSYFGSMEILKTDLEKNYSEIKIAPLGRTLMAGTPEAMDCEMRYFQLLESAKHIRIEGSNLNLGIFNLGNAPTRDGGTFLIFTKKEP